MLRKEDLQDKMAVYILLHCCSSCQHVKSFMEIWGFPNLGYPFGGPHNKDYIILGPILGSPCCGKLPYPSALDHKPSKKSFNSAAAAGVAAANGGLTRYLEQDAARPVPLGGGHSNEPCLSSNTTSKKNNSNKNNGNNTNNTQETIVKW